MKSIIITLTLILSSTSFCFAENRKERPKRTVYANGIHMEYCLDKHVTHKGDNCYFFLQKNSSDWNIISEVYFSYRTRNGFVDLDNSTLRRTKKIERNVWGFDVGLRRIKIRYNDGKFKVIPLLLEVRY